MSGDSSAIQFASQTIEAFQYVRFEMEQLAGSIKSAKMAFQEFQWSRVSGTEVAAESELRPVEPAYQPDSFAAPAIYDSRNGAQDQAMQLPMIEPDGIEDMNEADMRMQSLAAHMQQLNYSSLQLNTGSANQDLEMLCVQLVQAESIQTDLNDDMGSMSVTTANQSYTQLNILLNSAERNIQENVAAQRVRVPYMKTASAIAKMGAEEGKSFS